MCKRWVTKLVSTGELLSLCNINNMWCPFLQIFCLVVKAQFVINKHVQIFVFVKLLHSLALDNIGIWNRSTCPDAKLQKWILAPLNKVHQQVQGWPFILRECICRGIWIVSCLSPAGVQWWDEGCILGSYKSWKLCTCMEYIITDIIKSVHIIQEKGHF